MNHFERLAWVEKQGGILSHERNIKDDAGRYYLNTPLKLVYGCFKTDPADALDSLIENIKHELWRACRDAT